MSKKSASKHSSKTTKTDSKKTLAKAVAADAKPAKADKKVSSVESAAVKTAPKVTRATVVTRSRGAGDMAAQTAMLRKLSVAVYAVLAVAAGALMNGATQQVRWPYQTRDALASQGSTVFATGSKLLLEFPFRVGLIVILLLAALFSLLAMSKLKDKYARAVAAKVVGYRWVAIAITAGLIMEVVAMANGVQDVAVLKLMGGSVAVTALLSWLAERDNAVAGRPVWTAFTLSVFSGILPWLVILGRVVGTALYGGGVRMPWWVYALDAAVLIGFSLICLNVFMTIRAKKQWRDYAVVERNYTAISLALKTAFAVILICGLMR